MCNLIEEKTVKIKKDRICFGCSELILKNNKMSLQKFSHDGSIQSIYMCLNCFDYCEYKNCNECFYLESAFQGFIKECKELLHDLKP